MIAASSSEIVFCERTSILSRNRLIIFLGMLHILPLAGHMAEVPHPFCWCKASVTLPLWTLG